MTNGQIPQKFFGEQILKRFLLLFLGESFALAENFNKEELTKECMCILDNFGVADTFFTSKTCKSIIAEIEDEIHYGDSLFPIEQYNQCATYLMDDHGVTDTVTIQKVC